MSERTYSERMRLARIKRYAEYETEREDREAARERAADAAYPEKGFQIYETPIASPQEPQERQY